MIRAPIAAVRFLTRLPVPGPATEARDLPPAVGWFPLVGLLCNAAVAGAALGLQHWFPSAVAAVLAIAAGLLLTGGFHEDAASDAADGLGGGSSRERVLEIMRDSRIGAYGAMSLWVVLSLRWAMLTALLALPAPVCLTAFALAGAWGRWTAAPLLCLPSAAPGGLAKDVGAGTRAAPLLFASLLAFGATAAAWPWLGWRTALAAGAALLATGAWALYLKRRMGGQSGDLLGAGNLLAEGAALLALLAR